MPPLVNLTLYNQIQDSTDSGMTAFKFLSSGNVVTTILFSASLQNLWGLIRAMQFIVLMFLIKVPLPAHAFKFFVGCAAIA